MKTVVAFVAASLATAGTANAASVLVNGSFENPLINNACCNSVGAPGTIPGWTVDTGDVNIVKGTFASVPSGTNLAADGDQYLDLIGESGAGSISQIFATTPGTSYILSFQYSRNLFAGLPSAAAAFTVGSLASTIVHSTGSAQNLDWKTYTGYFTAGTTSATLNFVNTLGGQNDGIFLDNITVSAAPEPATWAMMILGFGLVGGALRRRKRTVAFA